MTQDFYDLNAEPVVQGERKPLIGDDRRLMIFAFALGAILIVWKIVMGHVAHILWDEAHFVVSGQHLDLAYPDIPAGYPWLARLSTTLLGWSIAPLRIIALLIGTGIPFAVYFAATPVTSHRNALWAAILSMVLPAVTFNGTIFYPEGGLQLMLALMSGCLVRAIDKDQLKWWALAGVCAAFGLLVHYRFLVPGLAVIVYMLANARGRGLWKKPGPYVTAVIAMIGMAPALVYNMENAWPAVQFHILNRPEYAFSLKYVFSVFSTQIIMGTPVLFVAYIWAAKASAWDERDQPGAILGYLSAVIFLFYVLQAPFNKRVMPHWPWLAFVPLIPYLPGVLTSYADAAVSASARWLRMGLVALAPVIALLMLVGFSWVVYAQASGQPLPAIVGTLSNNKKEDWALVEPMLAEAQARADARFGAGSVIAADGHTTAVHLEFPGVKGRLVYTLDEPYDIASRFVVARHKWGLDRAALLQKQAGKGVVLVLNEPEVFYHTPEEVAFYQDLCRQFGDIEPFRDMILPPGQVTLHVFTARAGGIPATGVCPLLPQLYIAQPYRGETLKKDDHGHYFGMAADARGVTAVDILIDGKVVAHAHYGLDPEGYHAPDALKFDPDWPNVQYDWDFPAGQVSHGKHELSLRATLKDGSTKDGAAQVLFID